MEIVHVYQKKRREFGRQCVFSDRQAKLIVDIAPDEELRKDYVYKNPNEVAVQCSSEFSEHEVNTERSEYADAGMNHREGGWPKDVDPNEVEQTMRFRKKVEKDEHYLQTVVNLGESMLHNIRQNNAIDIYNDYFPEPSVVAALEPPSARMVNVFRDPNEIPRTAASMSWHPDGGRKLAVAYSVLEFQKAPAGMCLDSYIWDLEKPNEPDFTLSPSSPLVSISYNPKDVHGLLGGCYNGQIAIWDTRHGSRPVDTSPIEQSHRDPVHSASFLNSKTGSEFVSCSTDGMMMWWDTRKLSEPTEVLELEVDGVRTGGTVLDYEATMPTRVLVGTEQGTVININRKGKTPADKLSNTFSAHNGPVNTVVRNPFASKYFLSVGDWTARVWCEDVRESAIMWTKYHPCYLTCGDWSQTRPGVAFTGKANGEIDVWDYLFKQSEPSMTLQVSDAAIRSIKSNVNGRLVACGDQNGSVTLVELGDTLAEMQHNEKSSMVAILERESSREKILASRMRELALKERARSARKSRPDAAAPDAEGGGEEEPEEDPIALAEESFWSSVDPEYYERRKSQGAALNGTAENE